MHRLVRYAYPILLLCFLGVSLQAAESHAKQLKESKELPGKNLDKSVEFAIGNVMFFVFHEAGHMLISEFGFPVLGNEEDAADSAAALFMLEADDALFDRMLADAAMGWKLVAGYKDGEDEVNLWDAHRLSEQRAYSIVCMMVGKSPKKFKKIAEEYELPDDRREECGDEYKQVSDSWSKLLAPHVAPDGHHTRFTVDYKKPDGRDLSRYVKMFRDVEVLEAVQAAFATPFDLKNGIRITAAECGEDNAYWSSEDRELTVCYELAKYYTELFADRRKNGDEAKSGAEAKHGAEAKNGDD